MQSQSFALNLWMNGFRDRPGGLEAGLGRAVALTDRTIPVGCQAGSPRNHQLARSEVSLSTNRRESARVRCRQCKTPLNSL